MQPQQQHASGTAAVAAPSIAQPRARVTLLSASRRSSMLPESERAAVSLPRLAAQQPQTNTAAAAAAAKVTSPPSAGRRAARPSARSPTPQPQPQPSMIRVVSGASHSGLGSPTSPQSAASLSSESAGSTTASSMASSRYGSYSAANPPQNQMGAAAAHAFAAAIVASASAASQQPRVLPVLIGGGGGSGAVSPSITSPNSGNGYPHGYGYGAYRSGAVSPPPGQPSALVARFHASTKSASRRISRQTANATAPAAVFQAQQQFQQQQPQQPQVGQRGEAPQPSIPSSRSHITIITSPPVGAEDSAIQTVPFVPGADASGTTVAAAAAAVAPGAGPSSARAGTPSNHRRSFSAAVPPSASVSSSASASAAVRSDSPTSRSAMISPTSFAAANLYSDDNPEFVAYKQRWEQMRDAQTALRRAGGPKDGRSLLSPVGSRTNTRANSPFSPMSSSGTPRTFFHHQRSLSASPATMNLPSNSLSPPSHSGANGSRGGATTTTASASGTTTEEEQGPMSVYIDAVGAAYGCGFSSDGGADSPFGPAPVSPQFADGTEILTPCSASSPGPFVHAGSAFAILVESNRNSPLPPSPVPGFLTYSPSGSGVTSPAGAVSPMQEPASPAALCMPPSALGVLAGTAGGVAPRVMSGAHARSRSFGQTNSLWPGAASAHPNFGGGAPSALPGSSAITRGLHSRGHSRSHSRGFSVASIPGPALPPAAPQAQHLGQNGSIASAVALSFPAGGSVAVPTAVAGSIVSSVAAPPSNFPRSHSPWRKVERVDESGPPEKASPPLVSAAAPTAGSAAAAEGHALRAIMSRSPSQRKELMVVRPPSAVTAAGGAAPPATTVLPQRVSSPSPLQASRARITILPPGTLPNGHSHSQGMVSPTNSGGSNGNGSGSASVRGSRRNTFAAAAAASLQSIIVPAAAAPAATAIPSATAFLPRASRT